MPSNINVVCHKAREICLKPSAISVILKEKGKSVFSAGEGMLPGPNGLKWQENGIVVKENKKAPFS